MPKKSLQSWYNSNDITYSQKEIIKKTPTNQQNPSQKIDNKDNSSKKVFYGIGVVSLVVLVISMLVVLMKKKK